MNDLNDAMGGLDLGIEDLETLEAPFNWGHFFAILAASAGLIAAIIAAA